MAKCNHDWKYEVRAEGKEFWKVCSLCGKELQLRIVPVEPLKHSSRRLLRKKRKLSSSEI